MKNSFLRLLCFILVTPVFLFAFTSIPDKVNFSGDWKLNESKSELGQFANFATQSIKSQQSDSAINISRTAATFEGSMSTSTETLTFDGKECESSLFGNSKKKATLKWAEDGQTFSITYTLNLDFNGQAMEVTGTETWTLSDGGKTLISINNSSSSFGDMVVKSVYEKQ